MAVQIGYNCPLMQMDECPEGNDARILIGLEICDKCTAIEDLKAFEARLAESCESSNFDLGLPMAKAFKKLAENLVTNMSIIRHSTGLGEPRINDQLEIGRREGLDLNMLVGGTVVHFETYNIKSWDQLEEWPHLESIYIRAKDGTLYSIQLTTCGDTVPFEIQEEEEI